MAINEILKKKIGRELREWIYLGIRTGMRRAVADYRAKKAGMPDEAALAIKRAIDLPRRARARIDEAISRYGQQQVVDVLTENGTVTIAELNAELTGLESYAQGLYDRRINDSESWDSLAADIEANVELESEKWVFPIPAGYTDIWGE